MQDMKFPRDKNDRIMKYNSVISVMHKDYLEAREQEDYRKEEEIEERFNRLRMPFKTLLKLEPANILYYININGKALERKNYQEGNSIIKRLMELQLKDYNLKKELVVFISWASGFNYSDSQIMPLVKKVCKYATFNDTNLLLSLESSLLAAVCPTSAAYVEKTKNRIKENFKLSKQEKTASL